MTTEQQELREAKVTHALWGVCVWCAGEIDYDSCQAMQRAIAKEMYDPLDLLPKEPVIPFRMRHAVADEIL